MINNTNSHIIIALGDYRYNRSIVIKNYLASNKFNGIEIMDYDDYYKYYLLLPMDMEQDVCKKDCVIIENDIITDDNFNIDVKELEKDYTTIIFSVDDLNVIEQVDSFEGKKVSHILTQCESCDIEHGKSIIMKDFIEIYQRFGTLLALVGNTNKYSTLYSILNDIHYIDFDNTFVYSLFDDYPLKTFNTTDNIESLLKEIENKDNVCIIFDHKFNVPEICYKYLENNSNVTIINLVIDSDDIDNIYMYDYIFILDGLSLVDMKNIYYGLNMNYVISFNDICLLYENMVNKCMLINKDSNIFFYDSVLEMSIIKLIVNTPILTMKQMINKTILVIDDANDIIHVKNIFQNNEITYINNINDLPNENNYFMQYNLVFINIHQINFSKIYDVLFDYLHYRRFLSIVKELKKEYKTGYLVVENIARKIYFWNNIERYCVVL